jgi:threonine/homoserine/homoserine lactone efflux protein
MGTFAVAVFLLIVTPGPGVLSTAGVGAGFGFARGATYVGGLCLGNALVGALVASGVAASLMATPWLRYAFMVASTSYLLWLALRIAMAGAHTAFHPALDAPRALDGVLLQLINPKAYAVNAVLFSGFAFLPEAMLAETLIKFLIINAIWLPLHFAWLYAGVALKRLALSENKQRWINRAMALCLAAVAALSMMSFAAAAQLG